MARYIYISRDWQREDDIMQCDDCKALIYSKFMNGHTTICGVGVEETGQEASRAGREEITRDEEDKSAIEGANKAASKSSNTDRTACHPASRRTGESGCSGDCKKDCARKAEATHSLFNV